MRIILSNHARLRSISRGITYKEICNTILAPIKQFQKRWNQKNIKTYRTITNIFQELNEYLQKDSQIVL
jgi:hypothetical protein